ncbi:hypothetical protein F5Y16DRAFT_395498 [Xylariaceae sp. FL0255]|nr:hypothetical protein F5Y16DRAFT_395498 [Xylariaceae sp. FL0255]
MASDDNNAVDDAGEAAAALVPHPAFANSTYRPRSFEATCTHLTMTRIYDMSFNYRELLIADALERGQPVGFDGFGREFEDQITPGLRSSERRQDKLSFFEELSPDQMSTYTPAQIATILKQRGNLLDVLAKSPASAPKQESRKRDSYFPTGSSRFRLRPPPGFEFENIEPTQEKKPWVPNEEEECQAKFCHRCRPTCESRACLSIDGILRGDIPPTAVTRFGFHRMGTRPIINAEVLMNIGLRAVPWPRQNKPRPLPSPTSPATSLDMTAEEIKEAERQLLKAYAAEYDELAAMGLTSSLPADNSATSTTPGSRGSVDVSSTGSPSPLPSSLLDVINPRGHDNVRAELRPFDSAGRSPDSSKANKKVHRFVDSTDGLMNQEITDEQTTDQFEVISKDAPAASSTNSSVQSHQLIKANLPQLPDHKRNQRANRTAVNGKQSSGNATPMMQEEMEEGRFHEEPLDVGDGLAVLEESVELGVPDVISHI